MKKTLWIFLFLGFLFTNLKGQTNSPFASEFNRLFKEGKEAMNSQNPDYSEAIAHFLAAGRADPSRAQEADEMVLEVMKRIQAQGVRERRARLQSDRLVSYFFPKNSNAKAAWAYGDNGKFAVIDREGNRLTSFVWEAPQPFINNYSIARRSGSYIILDEKGEEQSEHYDWYHPTSMGIYYAIQEGEKSIPLSHEGKKWTTGNYYPLKLYEIYPKFDYVIRDKQPEVIAFRQDGKVGLIDSLGNVLIPPKYERIIEDLFKHGRVWAKKDSGGKYGLIDISGNEVTPYIYDKVSGFSQGIAKVQEDWKWRFIDTLGKEITPRAFKEATDFHKGIACVQALNEKWGLINRQGKEITPFIYEEVRRFTPGIIYSEGDKSSLVLREYDAKGNAFSTINDVILKNYSQGGVWVRKDQKWGLIDTLGKGIIPPSYDALPYEYAKGIAKVFKEKKMGLIDTLSREIIPPLYWNFMNFAHGKWIKKGFWRLMGVN